MLPKSQLLAFGFGNLAMLGWLAAAAAPLLIHLWSRHRHREAPWAAMQFLLAAMRKNARRLHVQQWLLLAVRTLIIALIVLAVAEPYGERMLAGGSNVPTHKVLVIDGSYSMAYRDDETSRFERAKQLAAAEVRDSRPADSFSVILMTEPAKIILGPDLIEHAQVVVEIQSLAQSHTGADLVGALALVRESLDIQRKARMLPQRQEIYFFTDLQSATWTFASGPRAPRGNEAVRERIAAVARLAELFLIDVAESSAANLAVTSLTSPDPFATIGREITFEVALHQFAQEPRPDCLVEFLVDDVPLGEQTVDVPAGGDASVRFQHRFLSAGEYAIAVRAAGDRLEIDNSRWLVVPVREEVRVLCVSGRDGAAKYVADALNPNPAGDSTIRPVIVSEADLADLELSDFDCVFFCNVAHVTAGEAERLKRYTKNGGGVVFFLGDQVIPESYNALANHKQPLLPARIGQLVSATQFGLDPLEYRHPIVAPFRGRERAGLLTTPVSRYYRLDMSQSRPDAEVAAAMPGGDPFIVAAPLGRGRTVLVATDGSLTSIDATTGEPWTNWPTWPSFLPIVRELLAYASGGQRYDWQHIVGTPISSGTSSGLTVTSQPRPAALQIIRPDRRTSPVSIRASAASYEWTYGDTDLSGIYKLKGLPENEVKQFALNVNTAESDLAKADRQALPRELLVHEPSPRSDDTLLSVEQSRAGWNESLLWLAVALLFGESFLAWYFGRGAV